MSSFCTAKATHIFFSKKFQHICVSLDLNFNESLTNDIVSFEQLGPDNFLKYVYCIYFFKENVLTDDSHKISRLIFSEKIRKEKKIEYCLLQNLLGASRVKKGFFFSCLALYTEEVICHFCHDLIQTVFSQLPLVESFILFIGSKNTEKKHQTFFFIF